MSEKVAAPTAADVEGASDDVWQKLTWFLLFYFTIHVIARVFISGVVEFDESEQVVLTQSFRLGYGAQPPLYTWLQMAFFALLGRSILGLALLKNILLFLTYQLTFLSGREVTGDSRKAAVGALSLFLIPQIAWESQRDLTHTVLVTTLAALSFYLFLKMLRTGRMCYYHGFGLAAGLGLLAKYNFGIFLGSLLVALAVTPAARARVKNAGLTASIGIAAATAAIPMWWIVTHRDAAFSESAKLHAATSGWLSGVFAGATSLFGAMLLFLAVLVPVFFLIFRPKLSAERVSENLAARVAATTIVVGLCICVTMILFFGVSHFKDRWLQPVLYPLPLVLVGMLSAIDPARMRRYVAIAVGVAGVILVALPGQTLLGGKGVKANRLNADFGALAGVITAGGFSNGVIAADSNYIGGNLALQLKGGAAKVNVPEFPPFSENREVPWLVVWKEKKDREPPARLMQMVERVRGEVPSTAQASVAVTPLLRLNYIIIPPAGREGAENKAKKDK